MNTEYRFLKLPEVPSKGKVTISIEDYMELKARSEALWENYVITIHNAWDNDKTYYATEKDKFVRDLKDKIQDLQGEIRKLKEDKPPIKEKAWWQRLFG